MSFQTSRIQNVDVGAPPPSLSNCNEWESINVRYHGFENLTTTRGEYVESPEFSCFGHQWALKLYPGGGTNSDDGMVGIYLYNMSNESIKIKYGLCVRDKDRITKAEFLSKDEGTEFAATGTVADVDHQIGDNWGSNNFCDRTTIIDALVEGALIIEVRMRKIGETTTSFIPDNPIAKNLLSMFDNEESADIVFEVCSDESGRNTRKRAKTGMTFHAHRLIIQQCSSTLLNELCTSGGEAVSKVSITNVKPEVFKHMLYYVYGGKIAENDMTSNAREIIDAADRYGVVGLKLEAEAAFVSSTNISFDNAIDYLLYADATNCALLKESVVDYLVENGEEVYEKLSFDNVPGSAVKDLLWAMNRKKGGEKKQPGSGSEQKRLSTMRISDLREMLHEKGLDVDGSREAMIATLKENL